MTPPTVTDTATRPAPTPTNLSRGTLTTDRQSTQERVILAAFIALPFLAIVAAIPIAWGGWLGWRDVVIAVLMYVISGHGVTVGFHRLFTHRSFKATR